MTLRSAAVLLSDARGRVLLVQQAYKGHRYGLPGGRVDPGETPEETAVREACEEAGIEVALNHLIGRYRLKDGSSPHQLAFVYHARIEAGEPKVVDPTEIISVNWFDPSRPPQPLLNDAVAALEAWHAGRKGVERDHHRGT